MCSTTPSIATKRMQVTFSPNVVMISLYSFFENEKVYALVNTVGTTYVLKENFALRSTTKKTKMKNTIDISNHQTATATSNSWRKVLDRKQITKQSTSDMMSRRTTKDAKGGGDQSDRLCLQKGYLDVRFMVGKQT
jgi:hypothetical protein